MRWQLVCIWTRGKNLPGTIRLLACLGGCRLFWCSAPGAAPPLLPRRGFTLECPELPPLPLFPAGAARSIAAGVVARLLSQRRPGFMRSKWLASGSCTETINFPLFNLQVTGDQRQTLRLNPFGCWLVGWLVGWSLVGYLSPQHPLQTSPFPNITKTHAISSINDLRIISGILNYDKIFETLVSYLIMRDIKMNMDSTQFGNKQPKSINNYSQNPFSII